MPPGPSVSVFTPSHRPRFLGECYRSLAAESMTDWAWIVLENGEDSGSDHAADPDAEGSVLTDACSARDLSRRVAPTAALPAPQLLTPAICGATSEGAVVVAGSRIR